jgi:DNA-binding NarL/FixJ family response regulator
MTRNIRILIVDDHTVVRDGLNALLSAEPGMQVVGSAGDGQKRSTWLGSINRM